MAAFEDGSAQARNVDIYWQKECDDYQCQRRFDCPAASMQFEEHVTDQPKGKCNDDRESK